MHMQMNLKFTLGKNLWFQTEVPREKTTLNIKSKGLLQWQNEDSKF